MASSSKRNQFALLSLFSQDQAKDAFKELMMRHRNLRFVSVDAAKLETSIEKKIGLKLSEGAHQLLYFTRYNVGDKPKVCTARIGKASDIWRNLVTSAPLRILDGHCHPGDGSGPRIQEKYCPFFTLRNQGITLFEYMCLAERIRPPKPAFSARYAPYDVNWNLE